MAISERLNIAKRLLHSSREYLFTLLNDLSDDDWFWMPEHGNKTHVAWQVGHIAMAQYGLTLFRQRGRKDGDSDLMAGKVRKMFMKGTTPIVERDIHPDRDAILGMLNRVNNQMLQEIDSFDGDQLDEPVEAPYTAFATRYGALLFASQHEMLHAGQIGLLRRLMGRDPIR